MDYLRYYLNTLIIVVATAGFLLGGQFVWLGFSTFLIFLIWNSFSAKDFESRNIQYPLLADLVLYLHVPLMLIFYTSFIWRMAIGLETEGSLMTTIATLGVLLSLIWLSTLPNTPFLHELSHRKHPIARKIAVFMAAFVGDPSRDIAHITGHHLYFDTLEDGDTAYRGESVYQFIWRASKHSYMDTWRSEKIRLNRKGLATWSWQGRNFWNVTLVVMIPLTVGYFGGMLAAVIMIISIISAKCFLEALNYLQHYGLVRDMELPIASRHTWTHMSWLERVLGLEITNHIDHHKNSYLPYYQLKPYRDAPQMPNILACAILAFFPILWVKFIQKHLKEWDINMASDSEKKLAAEANLNAGWPNWMAST